MSSLHWVRLISQFGMVFAHHLILYAVWCFGILLERRVNIWHLKLFLSKNLLLKCKSFFWGKKKNNNKPAEVKDMKEE